MAVLRPALLVRLIVVAALCGSALGFVAHRSVADEPAPNYSGEWLFLLSDETHCIASFVQNGSALSSSMSCQGLGFLKLTGTIDTLGVTSIILSGQLSDGVVQMAGRINADWQPPFQGEISLGGSDEFLHIAGSQSAYGRGLVRCPLFSQPVGPFDPPILNSIDALLVQQYAAGLVPNLRCLYLGDVNVDGSVDSVDSLLLLQYIAHLIEHFPPY